MVQQYLISIDARLRSRNSTVSVKAETAECLRKGGDSRVSGCTRLNYRVMLIKERQYILFYFLFQIMVNKKHGIA